MPTPEQIERAKMAYDDAFDIRCQSHRMAIRAALAAAAPTPEEHERGVKAAIEAVRDVAALNVHLFGHENGCAETMAQKAVKAYIGAAWLTP